jgi:hypothetical protein
MPIKIHPWPAAIIGCLSLFPLQPKGLQGDPGEKKAVRYRIVAEIGIESVVDDRQKPYQFSSILRADFDAEGNIYVLDYKDVCVKVFDRAGNFKRTILGPGQGPNEIENPYHLQVRRSDRHLFVLHQHGFQIKEFDEFGRGIKSYSLPEQILAFFDFINERLILFVGARKYGEHDFHNLKTLNLGSKQIAQQIAPRSEDLFIGFQRFILKQGVVWTCPGDLMVLEAWDVESGEPLRAIPLPEKHIPFRTTGWGENIQKMRVSNYARPFLIGDDLFIFVTRQIFTKEPRDMFDKPLSRTVTTYRLDKYKLVAESGFTSFDFYVDLLASWKNRILISSSGYDTFPQIKVIEITRE